MDAKSDIVFVIDDQAKAGAFAVRLRALGFRLVEVRTTKHLLDLLNHGRPVDVVISALHQKGKGGIALLAKVRNNGFRVPFLFLPSARNSELLHQAARHRFVQFVGEGLSDKELGDFVRKAQEVGQIIRTLESGLQRLCQLAHFSGDKTRAFKALQERYFERALHAALHSTRKNAA